MNRIIRVLISLTFVFGALNTQGQKIHQSDSIFIIQKGFVNNNDISSFLIKQRAYVTFFNDINNNFSFANCWPESESMSSGSLTNCTMLENNQQIKNAKLVKLNCQWNYANNYDSTKGTADLWFYMISYSDSVKFQLEIATDKKDTLLYYGYRKF